MGREKTGIAGEFWFYSQLQRLGYEAYITLGNTKSIDISVLLSNDEKKTFDVKTKANFGGSFQYLNVQPKENHYYVFVNLATRKEGKKSIILDEPSCYIIHSEDLSQIAFHWRAKSSSAKGYGFEAKLLWFLKYKSMQSITDKNINNFKNRHGIKEEIDFDKYQQLILSLKDFEDEFHSLK